MNKKKRSTPPAPQNPPTSPPRLVLILGSTGTGKTTWLQQLLADSDRLIVVNPKGNEEKAFASLPVASSLRQAGEWALCSPTFRFQVQIYEPGLEFDAVCAIAQRAGDCTLAIDEVHRFAPNVFALIPRRLKSIILEGRTANIRVVATSQSPRNVHKDLLGEAADKQLVVFRITMKEDMERVGHYVPAAEIRKLKNFEAISFMPPDHIERIHT